MPRFIPPPPTFTLKSYFLRWKYSSYDAVSFPFLIHQEPELPCYVVWWHLNFDCVILRSFSVHMFFCYRTSTDEAAGSAPVLLAAAEPPQLSVSRCSVSCAAAVVFVRHR